MATVQDAVRRCLAQLSHELAGCLLYLDAGAAEAAATGVGAAALQELGVAGVADLAAASAQDLATAALLSSSTNPVRRVVSLVTTMLAEAEGAVLGACQLHAAAAQFTVLCCVSQAAHHDEAPGLYGSSCYASVGAAWQRQLNEQRLAAGAGPCSLAILHCPLLLCPLGGSTFVLPAAAAAASLPRAGRLAAGFSTTVAVPAAAADSDEDGDEPPPAGAGAGRAGSSAGTAAAAAAAGGAGAGSARGAPPPASSGLALLAHALVGATSALGHRPEAFSLGPCSRQVSRNMGFVPAAAEDAPPAALVLIDRLLDPVSPAQHADLLVQRLYDLPGAQLGPGAAAEAEGAAGSGSRGGGGAAGVPFAPLHIELAVPSLDAPPPPAAAPGAAAGGASGAPAATAPAAQGDARAHASLLPGSLRHADDAQAERWLDFLLSRRGRDGPLFIRKWLREAARKENASQPGQRFKPGSISAAELRSLADSLRRQSPASAHRHVALLQLAEAAAAALEGPRAGRWWEHWEALQREERQLLFACTESSEAAAAHLQELCQLAGAPGAPLGLSDVVLLVLQAYCLLPDFLPWFSAGDSGCQAFQPQQELQLQEALVDAVMASSNSSSTPAAATAGEAGGGQPGAAGPRASPAWLLEQLASRVAGAKQQAAVAVATTAPSPGSGGSGSVEDQEQEREQELLQGFRLEARDAVEGLLGRLRELSAFRRSHLKQLKALATAGQDGTPRPTPLLRQIVEAILRDQPLPDLHAGATSLSGLLRSGLGRFGLQAGPKPSDCSTVILFVLGGISMAELHDIMQAVEERTAQISSGGGGGGGGGAGAPRPSPPPRIIVGATSLLRPGDLCGHLFADLQAA